MLAERLDLNPAPARYRDLLGLTVVVLVAAKLLVFSQSLLSDPDVWWHIKLGLDSWASGALPTFDTYSHTFFGKPFIAKEWLSQILLYLAYAAGGWNAVVLAAVSSICCAALLCYWNFSRNLRPMVAAILTILSLFLSSQTFLARPHIFTLPLAVYWTDRLFLAADDHRSPSPWLLLLMILWTNLHGSFTLGFVIAGFAFLHLAGQCTRKDMRLLASWLLFIALCPVMSLIHPYTWQALWISFTMAGGNEAMDFIQEWQPFNASKWPLQEAGLLASLAALLWLRPRLGLARIALIAFSLHMYLTHMRFAYVYFLILPVALMPGIARQHPALSFDHWSRQTRDWIERVVTRNYRTAQAALAAAAAAILAVSMFGITSHPPERFSATRAIAFVQSEGIRGNVLNAYDFGGSLIFHGIRTFIDGRAEQLFLDGFITEAYRALQPGGEAVFAATLMKYDIAWTILPPGDPRTRLLGNMQGWRRAYADRWAEIYVRQDAQ